MSPWMVYLSCGENVACLAILQGVKPCGLLTVSNAEIA